MSRIREVVLVDGVTDLPITPTSDTTAGETNTRIGDNVTNPSVNSLSGRLKTLNANALDGSRKIQLVGSDPNKPATVNSQTGYLVAITQEEHKVYSGDMYFVSHSEKVKKKKVLRIVLSTPSLPLECHFDRNSTVITSKEAEVKVYVGMTTTGSLGTPVAVLNANGNSTNVSPVSVYINPTGTITPGILAYTELTDKDSKTISVFQKSHIVFRSGVNYMMEITSEKDSNIITLPFEFFIHNTLV